MKGRWHNSMKKSNRKNAGSLEVSGMKCSPLWARLPHRPTMHRDLSSISGKHPFWLNQPLLWTQLPKIGHLLPTLTPASPGTNRRNAGGAQTWCSALQTHNIIASIREGKKPKFTEIKQSAKSYRRVRIWTQTCPSPKWMPHFLHLSRRACAHTHTPPSRTTVSFTLYLKHIIFLIQKILELDHLIP